MLNVVSIEKMLVEFDHSIPERCQLPVPQGRRQFLEMVSIEGCVPSCPFWQGRANLQIRLCHFWLYPFSSIMDLFVIPRQVCWLLAVWHTSDSLRNLVKNTKRAFASGWLLTKLFHGRWCRWNKCLFWPGVFVWTHFMFLSAKSVLNQTQEQLATIPFRDYCWGAAKIDVLFVTLKNVYY